MFSHSSLFQFNCYSIHCAARFPSVAMRLRARFCHTTLMSCVEKEVVVSFPLDLFPPIQNFFSQLLFPIKLLSHQQCRLPSQCPPSLNQGNNGPPPPSPPTSCMKKAVMVSIPLDFIVSLPFQFFSHHFSVQLLFSQHAGCPPSVNQRNKVLQPPSLPAGCAEKAVMVSFPLVLFLSPPLVFFLTASFSS